MNQKTHYDGIDILKYIMSYAVIVIHVEAFDYLKLSSAGEWFIRQAVPFFFTVSGYLLSRKLATIEANKRNLTLIHRGVHLLKIFGIWLLIYLPLSVIFYYHSHFTLSEAINSYIYSVFVYGQSFMAMPLWFIYSMAIFCIVMGIIGWKRFTISFVMIIAIFVYLFEYAIKNKIIILGFENIIESCFEYTHRTLGGFIYLLSGYFIYRLFYLSIRLWIVPIFICSSLLLYYLDLPFWQVAGGIGFICFGLLINPPKSALYAKLKAQSMWIYYTHMLVVFPLLLMYSSSILPNREYSFYILAMLLTGLLAYCLWKLTTYDKFKKLQKLIN